MIVNLHGEMTSTPASAYGNGDGKEAVTVFNAEPKFVPQLEKLHADFPNLRIILEHVSTREGLDAVRKCGPKVGCLRRSTAEGC